MTTADMTTVRIELDSGRVIERDFQFQSDANMCAMYAMLPPGTHDLVAVRIEIGAQTWEKREGKWTLREDAR